MDTLWRDLVYALRGLRRNPGFTLLAILTAALGIGANTAIFSVVHGAVLKPLPYPEPNRLVFITTQFPALGFNQFWVSPPELIEFRQNNKAFSSVGAYRTGAVNLGTEHPSRPVSAVVTDDLLPTLGVKPMRGRGFTPSDTLPGAEDVAVLSYELWRTEFGGAEGALGQVIPVDGVKTRIVGIMPPGFDVHDQKVQIWLPLTLDPANPGNRGSHFLYLIGRLKNGMTLQQARADLERMLRAWPKASGGRHILNTTNHRMRFDGLQEDIVGGVRTAAWVLQAAVIFVLLIACANLASLLMARAEGRQREFAVRAALGAGRGRLLRQFVTEGLLLALAGGACGVLLAKVGVRALLATNPGGIPRVSEIGIDGTVLIFTLLMAIATGVVFGLVPLFRMSHRDFHQDLKETGTRATLGRARRRARSTLVVAEVALAVVLVVGAGLMLRTFYNLLAVDAGFDRSHLVTFRVVLPRATYQPDGVPRFFGRLVSRLEGMPAVKSVAVMSGLPPLREVNANDTDFEDISPLAGVQTPPENVDYWQGVSYNYAQTLGIPVIEGRSFEATDITGPPVVMVNETLARTFFPGRSAIGRRLRLGEQPWFTIIGVLKDVKQGGVGARTGTELYLLHDQLPGAVKFAYQEMNIALRTSLPAASLASSVRDIVRALDPALPVVALRSMDEVFVESVSRPRFLAVLLAIFAAVALVLAAVGAYGVLSYLVTERRREIGVRMALGADRAGVVMLVLRQGIVLSGIGIGVGIAASLALTRLLQSLLFGVRPTDPTTLALGVAFMVVVSFAACVIPARRASSVDPMEVLRAE